MASRLIGPSYADLTFLFQFASFTLPFVTGQALTSPKRGLVFVSSDDSSDDSVWTSDSDLTWYYNYGATPTDAFSHTGLQFVPMLWGAPSGSQTSGFHDTVKGLVDGGMNITYVLAFNEPDGCSNGGSCVDAGTAAQLWQTEIEPLKKLGIKLGAPAVTGAESGFAWLQNFYTHCAGNCSSDFIPVHWYGNFEGLASHVGQVNSTYQNMTMWVTEYGYPGASLEDSQGFYNSSANFFDQPGLSYLTHYAYFGAFRSDKSNVGPNEAMLTKKGQLTDIGAWYLGQDATGHVPSGAARSTTFLGWVVVVTAATLLAVV